MKLDLENVLHLKLKITWLSQHNKNMTGKSRISDILIMFYSIDFLQNYFYMA